MFYYRNYIFVALAIVSAIALIGVGYYIRSIDGGYSEYSFKEPTSIDACVEARTRSAKMDILDVDLAGSIETLCFNQVLDQYNLNDYLLRKRKFIDQSYEDRIILWVVVFITTSGIILAGIQMVASYQLASKGKEKFSQSQELRHENGKLVLKSSVTGLLILVVSFAFFYIYISQIEPIKEQQIGGTKPEIKQIQDKKLKSPPGILQPFGMPKLPSP